MRGATRRTAATLCATAVLAAGALAGCGGGSSAVAPPSGGSAASPAQELGTVTIAEDGVQEVTLQTQDDYVFTPDRFTVAPGTVRLTLVNAAEQMTHNLEFEEGEGPEPITAGIDFLAPGEEKTIEFEVSVPGDHPFVCTFHERQNQVGTMTVSEGG